MTWGLVIANRAKRQLRRLSGGDRERIDAIFYQMRKNPFQGDTKRLRGLYALRRRVGDWRILYTLRERERIIVVTAVERRGSNTY